MPTYVYRCEDCSTIYEERRRFDQAGEPSTCPDCEGIHVQRMISVPVLIRSSDALSFTGGGCACSSGGACACRAASN